MARKVRKVRRVRARQAGESEDFEKKPEPVTEDTLRKEYAYVLKDLRRVAILAAAMFILLILLNLLLQ